MPPCHGGGRGFESRPVRKKENGSCMCRARFIFWFKQNSFVGQNAALLAQPNAGTATVCTFFSEIYCCTRFLLFRQKSGPSQIYCALPELIPASNIWAAFLYESHLINPGWFSK